MFMVSATQNVRWRQHDDVNRLDELTRRCKPTRRDETARRIDSRPEDLNELRREDTKRATT